MVQPAGRGVGVPVHPTETPGGLQVDPSIWPRDTIRPS